MIVIDVVDNCLMQATSAVQYFALSYVWGAVEMSKTLRINYAARLQKDGLGGLLPRTIADAIALVRSLGGRFLWVDALCIVQDDEMRMQHDIKHMDIIFGKAFTTIVAMHGSSAEAGLPGVNSTSRPPQQIESMTVSGKSKDLDFDPDNSLQETVHIVASPMPLHLALEASTVDTRGWVLQERLLSRRYLYFSHHCVYFQCGREVVDEFGWLRIPESIPLTANEEPSNELSNEGGTIRPNPGSSTNLGNPLLNLEELVDFDPEKRLFKTFAAYAKLVQMYTLRKLSYESDVLNAFSGLFAILNQYFQGEIVSGLPTPALNLALLWAPAARVPRRGCKLQPPDCTWDFNLGQVDRDFPRWSWAGWTGPVDYCFFAENMSTEESLPTPLTNSYTIKVDEKFQTIPARISGQQ